MLQLPDGFRLDPEPPVPAPDPVIHLFQDNCLVQRQHQPPAQHAADYGELLGCHCACERIGEYHGKTHLALALPTRQAASLPAGWQARNLRSWFGELPDSHLAIAMQGSQLLQWARTHRYCGACGSPTFRRGSERAMQCRQCGLTSYPRISPAMMVLITRGRQMLLARNIHFPPGRYSALAGFLEVGETVEAAIHREVREEVGLQVQRLNYFGSQSWPFPHSLMIAFTAEWLAGEISPDPTEISDARWFDPEALPELPPAGLSISRALIDHTAARLRQMPAAAGRPDADRPGR